MDKFFLALVFVVFGSLVMSVSNTFSNQSSASTFKSGVEVMIHADNVVRAPAIVTNK